MKSKKEVLAAIAFFVVWQGLGAVLGIAGIVWVIIGVFLFLDVREE